MERERPRESLRELMPIGSPSPLVNDGDLARRGLELADQAAGRILHFPDGDFDYVGRLSLRDARPYALSGDGWEEYVAAQGDVWVPPDKETQLFATDGNFPVGWDLSHLEPN